MHTHTAGDVNLADELRFAPSPEVIGLNNAVLKSPSGAGKENYHPYGGKKENNHPDLAPSTSKSQPLPPTNNLRLKVRVGI